MTIQIGVYATPTGRLIEDLSARIQGCVLSTGPNGFTTLKGFIPKTQARAFDYQTAPVWHVAAIAHTSKRVWEGRLEDRRIVKGGVQIGAFGYQNGYRDKDAAYSASHTAVSPQTIVNAVIASVSGVNSFMSASTALVEDPGTSLTKTYVRQTPAAVLDGLATSGAGVGAWEWGVYEGRQLHFRERGSRGRRWFVRVSDLDMEFTLSTLFNLVSAEYANTATATATDAFSVAQYGVTREAVVQADTDSATEAGYVRDVFLAEHATPPVRASIPVTRLYDATGACHPNWEAQAGDNVTITNLLPTFSTEIDRVRSFILAGTDYYVDTDHLDITPELELPTVYRSKPTLQMYF